MTTLQETKAHPGAVVIMRRQQMPTGGVGQAPDTTTRTIRETVAYEIHPPPNSVIANSSIPPSMIQASSSMQSSPQLWLTTRTSNPNGALGHQKALPNIESPQRIGPRLLGSYPGLIQGTSGVSKGVGGKRPHRIIRHATFSDSFLHSRMEPLLNGGGSPLGNIGAKDPDSNPGDVRKAVSAGTTFSNGTSGPSVSRRIRFHSVDGSHYIVSKHSKFTTPGLQNIMRSKFAAADCKSDSSSKSEDCRNKTKDSARSLDSLFKETDKTIDSLQERAKQLKRIVEQDKNNNNHEPVVNKSGPETIKHRNYCDARKTNQVVKWLKDVNKEMYEGLT